MTPAIQQLATRRDFRGWLACAAGEARKVPACAPSFVGIAQPQCVTCTRILDHPPPHAQLHHTPALLLLLLLLLPPYFWHQLRPEHGVLSCTALCSIAMVVLVAREAGQNRQLLT